MQQTELPRDDSTQPGSGEFQSFRRSQVIKSSLCSCKYNLIFHNGQGQQLTPNIPEN